MFVHLKTSKYPVKVDITDWGERPLALRWQTFDWSSHTRPTGGMLYQPIGESGIEGAIKVMASYLERDLEVLARGRAPGTKHEIYFDIRESSLHPKELLSKLKERFPEAKYVGGKQK